MDGRSGPRHCRSNPPLSAKKNRLGHEGDLDPLGLLGFTPRFALRSASSAAGGHPPSADRPRRSRVLSLPYSRAIAVRIPHSPPKKAAWDTRVISTHSDFWDSLRASRSVPRHWLRTGLRLRRTGCERSRVLRLPIDRAQCALPLACGSRIWLPPTCAPLPFESPTLRQKKPPGVRG